MAALRMLERADAYPALEAFMRSFSLAVADAMEDELEYNYEFMDRIGVAILVEAYEGTERSRRDEDRGDLHFLGRLEFDGRPLALVRFDEGRRIDSSQRWTVRMTSKAVADCMSDAILDVLSAGRDRLREVDLSDETGGLLEFGINAVLDVDKQSLRFQETRRLLLLTHHSPVAVLCAIEDGRFTVGCVRDGEDRFEAFDTAEAALGRFREQLLAEMALPLGRSPLVLHGRADEETVGLSADRTGEAVCSVISGKDRRAGAVERARGDGAGATFTAIAEGIMLQSMDMTSVQARLYRG